MSSTTLPDGATAPSESHPLTFRGTSGEFMRIWWTNLLLTICTLGIYSAWAKVRTRKWFYGNAELDGSTFNYHADPKAILKGRVIVVGIYLGIVTLSEFLPLVGGLLMLLVFLLLPWVIVRSLRFNARNTSYRGVRMDFANDFAGAFLLFALMLPLVFVTLGLAWPWWKAAFMRFLSQHRYGTEDFRADVPVGTVYGIYLKAVGLLLLLALLVGVGIMGAGLSQPLGDAFKAMEAAQAARAQREAAANGDAQMPGPAGGDEAGYGDGDTTGDPQAAGDEYDAAVRAAIAASEQQAAMADDGQSANADDDSISGTSATDIRTSGDGGVAAGASYAVAIAQAADDTGSPDEAVAEGDAVGMDAEVMAEADPADATATEYADADADADFDMANEDAGYAATADDAPAADGAESAGAGAMLSSPASQFVFVVIMAFYVLAIFVFLVFGAYIDARLTNLLWGQLKLGAVTFTCNLRARDLAWLRISNFLICVFTLFIAYPVTQVRNARYRLSRMTVEGNVGGFVAAQVGDAGALGEEAGDLLDIDIAL